MKEEYRMNLPPFTAGELDALTLEEMEALEAELRDAIANRRFRADAERAAHEIAARFAESVAGDAPIPHAETAWPVGPGRRIVWSDGHTYRNISRGWLSHGPDEYRRGWENETPDGPEPWDPARTYIAGEACLLDGIAWRVRESQQANPGWQPDDPALWGIWEKVDTP